jgi:hypothetical protein
VRKEWRELLASRAWWVLLGAMGPLVGVSFISAVQTYAEASGLNGTSAGVGEAFSPLIGVWAPTFSACELAAAFLLPFVCIRVAGGDLQTGALKIELQRTMPPWVRVGAKAAVLITAWMIASLPVAAAVLLWRSYGGVVYAPELMTVAVGHLLNAGLTIALGTATALMTDHPSTAAIVTLSVTVGTWILNFVAAVHGGLWQRAAEFTPTAVVASFQHGLIALDVLVASLVLIGGGLGLGAIWIRLGVPTRRRIVESAVLVLVVALLGIAAARLRPSWDLSEPRLNSFSHADEAALRALPGPLDIEVHLAPEDPRRSDLDRNALGKLRRVVPVMEVEYISETTIGLFEQTRAGYGEIWYGMNGHRVMSRATTPEGVLEAIYEASGVDPPDRNAEPVFRGHPLAVPPRYAAQVFYVAWPAAVMASFIFVWRKHS